MKISKNEQPALLGVCRALCSPRSVAKQHSLGRQPVEFVPVAPPEPAQRGDTKRCRFH